MSSPAAIQIDLNDNHTVKLINIVNDVINTSTSDVSRDELLGKIRGVIDTLSIDDDLKKKLGSSELLSHLVDGFLNGSVRGTEIVVDALPAAIQPSRRTIGQILSKCIRAILSCLPHGQAISQSAVPPSTPHPSPIESETPVSNKIPTDDEPPALELSPDVAVSNNQITNDAN